LNFWILLSFCFFLFYNILIHQEFYQKFLHQELVTYLYFLIFGIWVYYIVYINPIFWEILLNICFYLYQKELNFLIFFFKFMLCYDINTSNSFLRWLYKLSYFRISILLFKIMKDESFKFILCFIFSTSIYFWIILLCFWKIIFIINFFYLK